MDEKYEVIHSFKDLKDNDYVYIADKSIYPREGLKLSKKRIEELASTKNKIGKVLIQKIEKDEEKPTKETEVTE